LATYERTKNSKYSPKLRFCINKFGGGTSKLTLVAMIESSISQNPRSWPNAPDHHRSWTFSDKLRVVGIFPHGVAEILEVPGLRRPRQAARTCCPPDPDRKILRAGLAHARVFCFHERRKKRGNTYRRPNMWRQKRVVCPPPLPNAYRPLVESFFFFFLLSVT